jgi:hypothetical protein
VQVRSEGRGKRREGREGKREGGEEGRRAAVSGVRSIRGLEAVRHIMPYKEV